MLFSSKAILKSIKITRMNKLIIHKYTRREVKDILKLNKKQRNYKTLITKTLPQNIINYHQSTDKKG